MILQGLKGEDLIPKTISIYDVSKKTSAGFSLAEFSLINTAQASPGGAVATTMSGGIVLQGLALAAALKTSSSIASGAMNMARAFPQAALITGTTVGLATGLHNSAQFEMQHPLLSSEFNDIMTNPYIPQSVKDNYWQKATNDPLLGGTGNRTEITMPIMESETSILLRNLRMDIDPNANKPTILSTPIPEKPRSILFTPDDRNILRDLGRLEGFAPVTPSLEDLTLSTPIYQQDWRDLILYKDYLDTVEKINGRYLINGDWASNKYPLSEELQQLYPKGVWFKENGHPDFTPYADITVEVEGLTGNHYKDFQKAKKAAVLSKTPIGKTWHHVEDGKTMQLVPEDLHYQVKHTGGAALLKGKNK